LVKYRYRLKRFAVRFNSSSRVFAIFDVMSHVISKTERVTQRERAYYYFSAVAPFRISDENVFQFSLVHNFRERTRTLYLFLPSLFSPPPSRCCLRKNQLYPAISIGLHAKMSTLYCYHRHIIRDIGTSHFPVGGYGIGCTFALTAAAKPIKRQIHTYARAISKELLHVV